MLLQGRWIEAELGRLHGGKNGGMCHGVSLEFIFAWSEAESFILKFLFNKKLD